MARYTLNLAYHGQNYVGFQIQPSGRTIQRAIESALQRILNEAIRIIPSGRTDTGVHALRQTIHFDATTTKAINRLNEINMAFSLNAVLPPDIRVLGVKKCSQKFHARRHSHKKTYVYHLHIGKQTNPFLNNVVWYHRHPLDQAGMQKAASQLIGKKDFSAFSASDSHDPNKVKEIYQIKFSDKNIAPALSLRGDKFISIEFTGKGFLKQMVRNIVGTLVAVGQNKIPPQHIKEILKSKDRRNAAATAPPQALFLKNVQYR